MLAENKVRAFLVEVLSRTAAEKTGCDKPGLSVRDDEKVGLHFHLSLGCIALTRTYSVPAECICLYDQPMFKSLI